VEKIAEKTVFFIRFSGTKKVDLQALKMSLDQPGFGQNFHLKKTIQISDGREP
jgi:hypothetical protein